MSNLKELFHQVAALVRDTPVTSELVVSTEDKLRMYGLYKQATEGVCPEGTVQPPLWQPILRAKYDAWVSYRSLDPDEAMIKYVRLAAGQNHWLGLRCRNLLKEYELGLENVPYCDSDDIVATNDTISSQGRITITSDHTSRSQINDDTSTRRRPWLTKQLCGFQPLIPRGKLDISPDELLKAALFSLESSSAPLRESCETEICRIWNQSCCRKGQGLKQNKAVVGLSVRTLFDLYLRARNFPPGSEIIISPPINIPAMISILTFHDIRVVPVDLPKSFASDLILRIDFDQIMQSVTSKTKAIMIVHPFGIETTTENDLKQLCDIANKHNLDLIEDRAECYAGNKSTFQPYADVVFFSFGTIKTATALGGGIAVVRDAKVGAKMIRMHQCLYEPQSQAEFFWKVVKAALIQLLVNSPYLYALLFFASRCFGLDFDHIVSTSTRSFSSILEEGSSSMMQSIRRRPCLGLLKTLMMKLKNSERVELSQALKRLRCETLMAKLENVHTIKWPKASKTHYWWLAPIIVKSPDVTRMQLLRLGYDLPRGLSQLQSFGDCPRAQELMRSILYLPVSSRCMSDIELSSLANALSIATNQDDPIDKTLATMPWSWLTPAASYVAHAVVFCVICGTPSFRQACPSIAYFGFLLTLLCTVLSCLLTFFMAEIYMQSSRCFAKHNPMLRRIMNPSSTEAVSQQAILDDLPALHLPNLGTLKSEKCCVVLTGATGFLGSSILYQLLSNREVIQSIDRIILICRPRRGKSAVERIHELLDQEMFSFFPKHERDQKILIVAGDISQSDAGLTSEDIYYLSTKLRIEAVINSAASVKFTQSLDEAAAQNITSALHLLRLSRKLNAKLVHISTAFVHGGLTGTKTSPLTETLFSLEKFNADKIYRSMTGNQMYASMAMSTLGFHNTYTFSKCIAEHLLLQRSNDDVVIIRPSIIGPALSAPFEGWAGQKPSTIVAATCLYLKYPLSVWSFGKQRAAVIPVDIVARFVLVKALRHDISETFRLSSSSECSSGSGSDFEKVTSIAEVESLSSDGDSSPLTIQQVEGMSSPVIFNAAWNFNSSAFSSFLWYDFATSVPHLGTVLGAYSRVTAYIGFAISVRILPSLHLKAKHFAVLYHLIVQSPFALFVWLLDLLSWKTLHRKLLPLSSVLDLPVLFYPFANSSFFFDSHLNAPPHFDGQRYMFSCIASAHRFLCESPMGKSKGTNIPRDTSNILIGGKDYSMVVSDFQWALTQPCGSILVRFLALLFLKILRYSCTSVCVDAESFGDIARMIDKNDDAVHVVLAPTHRSFYDFILISFLAFSLPELNIRIPFIAAAHEFSNLPFLGFIIENLNTFFIKRGCGQDPDLASQLQSIKKASNGKGAFIEVFIEGSRSRDRRFLRPKTGFIRCLMNTGGTHLFVPICVNYERVPEQNALAREGIDGKKQIITENGLLSWIWETFMGKRPLGSIHIAASTPILVTKSSDVHFESLASEIQLKQQSLIRVTPFHVKGAEILLGVSFNSIAAALSCLGCEVRPNISRTPPSEDFTPRSLAEAWSLTMHFGHLVAPMLRDSHAFWADWISPFVLPTNNDVVQSDEVVKLVRSFKDLFDRAERAVQQAIQNLKRFEIRCLSREHVVHIARRCEHDVPDELLHAYATRVIGDINIPTQIDTEPCQDLFVGNDEEDLGMWGFKDSRFQVRAGTRGKPSIVMSGTRYAISGKTLTQLVPFIEQETKTAIDLLNEPVRITGLVTNKCELSTKEIDEIKKIVTRMSVADGVRARHGTGHSHLDMYQLRRRGNLRVPDIVVWPSSEEEIQNLIQKAIVYSWILIPHGGGTNVSQATHCPTKAADPRAVVSVDMTDLKRILYINEEDGLAHVQAGITGGELIELMNKRGYTIGHEPDSLEFSTLGGWIATKASGMKRSKYGNIENVVADVRVAGSAGLFWQGDSSDRKTALGRQSRGPDLLSLFFGSEGCLGIITSAIIRIWPLPAVQRYESVILKDFDVGLQFAQSVSKLGPFIPASVRLLDNAHFRLGQALREEASLHETLLTKLWQNLSPTIRSMSRELMACAIILLEGSEDETRAQHWQLSKLVTTYGGFFAGPNVGRSGYELTYVIAYLRDFALSYNFLGDSFETFAPWSQVLQIIASTKKRIKDEHRHRCLPGEVFVGCRVTQLYHDGACVYFYVCMYCGNIDNASAIFHEIEHAARQEILNQGGSLSHHHGVGKLRADFLKSMDSKPLRDGLLALKKGIDPSNVFGAGNGVFSLT